MLCKEFTERAVYYRAFGQVVAQGLDMDVHSTATSLRDLWAKLSHNIVANMLMAEECGYIIPRAPQICWDAFGLGFRIKHIRPETVRFNDSDFTVRPNVRFYHHPNLLTNAPPMAYPQFHT